MKLETTYIDYELILSLLIQEYDTSLTKVIDLQNDDETLIRTIIFKEENDNKAMLHDTRSEMNCTIYQPNYKLCWLLGIKL